MSEEPRRSGRATKGQHKNASPSPAPNPRPNKTGKSKPAKKSADDDDDDDGDIRCICGNKNPKDKRAFIGCDACTVWQHNVCMGIPEDEDDVPEHYFCEECKPDEHTETLLALKLGEKIWEARNRIYHNEKKMSKSRKTNRKSGDEIKPGWLKKDVPPEEVNAAVGEKETESSFVPLATSDDTTETGSKRKREDGDSESRPNTEAEEKSIRASRQEKRRKSAVAESNAENDPATALVEIPQLPQDRQRVAQALSKIIAENIEVRSKSDFRMPKGQTVKSLGDHYASRIEYALLMNHGNPKEPSYLQQFRALNANMKKNNVLIARLLDSSLTADDLATMSTSEMASDELQRERAVMKEALDRQAIAVAEEGPRYKQDHKGYQLIEDDNQHLHSDPATESLKVSDHSKPAERPDTTHPTGDPMHIDQPDPTIDGSRQSELGEDRRSSTQQFDVNNIWAKTAQSPVSGVAGAKNGQMPIRRQSSVQHPEVHLNTAKDDPDIDRLLDDNEEAYSPAEATGPDTIVWRGKLAQNNEENGPTVNARFAAGRDLSSTVAWQDLFPATISIDGRLQTSKAEEYLCGLRWSTSSDVCTLTMTPYDDRDAFDELFEYFHSRKRYAVVAEGKPAMVKDLYIIPVEAGGNLPDHVDMLEHCTIEKPIQERLLLMTLVVARSPESPTTSQEGTPSQVQPVNGKIAPHLRQSFGGPAGSPLNAQNPVFSPPSQQTMGYSTPNTFPPNPYGPPPQTPQSYPQGQVPQPHPDPRINHILGSLQYAPALQTLLSGASAIDDAQLYNLRRIVTEDPQALNDLSMIGKALGL